MLAQEVRLNCADDLVIGGLANYVSARWRQEAEQEAADEQERLLIARIAETLAAYATLDPELRRQAAADCRGLLAEIKPHVEQREPQPHGKPTHQARQPQPARQADEARPRHEGATEAAEEVPGIRSETPQRPHYAPVRAHGLDAPVTTLQGVSTGYAAKLEKLGVRTVRDLLYYFPRRYNDFTKMKRIAELAVGEVETVVGTVWEVHNSTTRSGKVRTEAIIADETGTIQAVWFGQPYLSSTLTRGSPVVLSGRVSVFLGRRVLEGPEYELLESQDLIHTARLAPVYPLTEGIGARWMRRLQKRVVDRWAGQAPEFIPAEVRRRAGLPDLAQSLADVHFPADWEAITRARRRLAFDELFLIQIGLLQRKRQWRDGVVGTALPVERAELDRLIGALPFSLTGAQGRSLDTLLADIEQTRPMSRLLQGDVGSGKTVVALLAILAAAAAGYQAAMMAPTEILAQQHYKTILKLLAPIAERLGAGAEGVAPLQEALEKGELPDRWALPPLPMLPKGLRVARLLGSQSSASKDDVRAAVAAGEIDLLVGTHALIEEGVAFTNLALIVIDEQHRFGVMQRSALRQKGYNPHVLVMTATPIPRTLALTMYGDLDISTIDEMPPGRQVVKTKWLERTDRERAYRFIRNQVEEGHQAFVICPLIEESEAIEAKAAVEEYERLRKDVFPDLRLGLVHGRLKGSEKDDVMTKFAQGELNILVSTSVVEVGIDVPNATVMLVEGANRFGLSQLHQFRGRVGRGPAQAYCILLADEAGAIAEQRLAAIETTHDGFKLAEIDLDLRGPGEFFGTRQSGLPDLKVAEISNLEILEQARAEATRLFEHDPDLALLEHQPLAQKVAQFWQKAGEAEA